MIDTDRAEGRRRTAEEESALAAAQRWVELHNQDDMAALVTETYHPDAEVFLFDGVRFPGREPAIDDPDTFTRHERNMLDARPGRRLRVRHAVVSGSTVVLELDFHDVEDPGVRPAELHDPAHPGRQGAVGPHLRAPGRPCGSR